MGVSQWYCNEGVDHTRRGRFEEGLSKSRNLAFKVIILALDNAPEHMQDLVLPIHIFMLNIA